MAWPSTKQDDLREAMLEDHRGGHLIIDPIDCEFCMDTIRECPHCGQLCDGVIEVVDYGDPDCGYGPIVEQRCSLCLTK